MLQLRSRRRTRRASSNGGSRRKPGRAARNAAHQLRLSSARKCASGGMLCLAIYVGAELVTDAGRANFPIRCLLLHSACDGARAGPGDANPPDCWRTIMYTPHCSR